MKKLARNLIELSLSKTARHTYYVTFGSGGSAILAFIFTVLIGRSISLGDFGYFSAIMSFILLTSDVADVGIGSSLARFLPPLEKNKKALFQFYLTSFGTQLGICVFLFISILMTSSTLARFVFHRDDFTYLIELTAIGVVGSVMSNFYLYTCMARQRFTFASFYMIFTGVLRLIFFFATIAFFPLTLANLIYLQVASLVVGAIAGQLLCGFDFLGSRFSRADFIQLVKFSSFLGIARSLTAIAGKLDVLLLVSLSGPTEAGIYALAAKIIAIYPLLSGSFSNVIAPRLSAISQKNELWAFIKKVIAGTFFFISTVFFMIIVADPFIRILFGEKFSESIPVFRLLLVSMIFFVGSVPSVSVAIYYLKKPWILTVNSVIQVVIVFVGNILTIPIYGRFAPAYVSIVAFGFTWFLTSMLSFSYLKKHHER